MGTYDISAVTVWTTTGHHLTRLDSPVHSDRRDERMIDDVVADEWIYAAPESKPVTDLRDVSDPAGLVRRAGVILL